jgi:hypothetical protein
MPGFIPDARTRSFVMVGAATTKEGVVKKGIISRPLTRTDV